MRFHDSTGNPPFLEGSDTYYSKTRGWLCPACGAGVSPWLDTCPCRPIQTLPPALSPGWLDPQLTGPFWTSDPVYCTF